MKRQLRNSSSRKLHVETLEHRKMLATLFVDAAADAGGTGAPNDPFNTIQAAIDVAADSKGPDTVMISPGLYQEALDIEDSSKLTLHGNGATLDATGEKHGVKIRDSGDVTIRNLQITDADKDGISAKDVDSLTLVEVNAFGNGDEGVQIEKAGEVTVLGGSFSNNDDDGFKVEEAGSVKIISGTFSNNGSWDAAEEEWTGDGIDLEVIDSIFALHVTAVANKDEGFEVDDSGTVVVDGGYFADNTDEGIDIDNTGQITVRNVEVSGNGGAGLQIEGDDADYPVTKVIVKNSSFTDNGGDGIQIVQGDDGSVGDVTLTSVQTTDNVESGLEIDITGALKSKHVTSEDNGLGDIT